MKGKLICLAASIGTALLGGCATPPPANKAPIVYNTQYDERCYSMDYVDKERAGQAYLAEGEGFYFTNDCDPYRYAREPADEPESATAAPDKSAASGRQEDDFTGAIDTEKSETPAANEEGDASSLSAPVKATNAQPTPAIEPYLVLPGNMG